MGGDRGNSYFFGEVSYEISGAPVTLTARLGYERGFFDEVEGGGKWDWSVGGEWTVGKVSIGIGYAGCGPGRVESHALVGSLLFAF